MHSEPKSTLRVSDLYPCQRQNDPSHHLCDSERPFTTPPGSQDPAMEVVKRLPPVKLLTRTDQWKTRIKRPRGPWTHSKDYQKLFKRRIRSISHVVSRDHLRLTRGPTWESGQERRSRYDTNQSLLTRLYWSRSELRTVPTERSPLISRGSEPSVVDGSLPVK